MLVFGVMADKDVAAIGRLLFPLARAVVVTRAPGERAATPVEIVERVGPVGPPVRREAGIARALAAAVRLAGPDGLVVVAGSLYLVGDVLAGWSPGRARPRARDAGRRRARPPAAR